MLLLLSVSSENFGVKCGEVLRHIEVKKLRIAIELRDDFFNEAMVQKTMPVP